MSMMMNNRCLLIRWVAANHRPLPYRCGHLILLNGDGGTLEVTTIGAYHHVKLTRFDHLF